MQRLVCVTTSGALGGAETSLLTLLRALRVARANWVITVLAPTEGPLLDACRASGFGAVALPYPRRLATLGEPGARGTNGVRTAFHLATGMAASAPYLMRLRRLLQRLRPTIVHSNGMKAHIATSLVVPRPTRLVWHLHEYIGPRPATARLLRLLSSRPDAIVVNSDSVRDEVQSAFGPGHSVQRIHNAVDLSAFSPDGPALDLARASGLAPDAGLIRIGLVATFGRWKGHEVFLDALARLSPAQRVRGYVIGGPVYQTTGSQRSLQELQTYAAKRGLREMVGFTGHVHDIPSALRGLDIVVHASTSPEPFGMVIAEAMAAGRAVVAVRAGGARELFHEGTDAIGHEMGDADDLARQLNRLVEDAALRASLGHAARRSAERRFSTDRMASEFIHAYAQ